MSKTAKFVKTLDGWNGDAILVELSEPMTYSQRVDAEGIFGEREDATTRFVAVSATVVPYSGPETYIFATNEEGEVLDWLDLDGSFRGDLDHAKALKNAGYELVME